MRSWGRDSGVGKPLGSSERAMLSEPPKASSLCWTSSIPPSAWTWWAPLIDCVCFDIPLPAGCFQSPEVPEWKPVEHVSTVSGVSHLYLLCATSAPHFKNEFRRKLYRGVCTRPSRQYVSLLGFLMKRSSQTLTRMRYHITCCWKHTHRTWKQ